MRKNNRRTAAAIMTAAVLAGSLAGCSMDSLTASLGAVGLAGGIRQLAQKNKTVELPSEPILDEGNIYMEEYEAEPAWESAPNMMMAGSTAIQYNRDDGAWTSIQYGWDEPDWNTEEYSYTPENGWMSVAASPFSTFAADVDTASYANLRRMINQGKNVPADAVRIEEMLNYFHYNYPAPQDGEPFSVVTRLAPCPWNTETDLFLVGLQAGEVKESDRPASNLVFLVDVSGSMDEPDKLPLVQRAFRMLAERMDEHDRISIVTYASQDDVILEGTPGDEHTVITSAIEDLFASGGTNGSAGIQTAYSLAEKYFIEGGNNRVILATDGDLNIGITDEGSLTRLIQKKAESGVFLSVLGFGWGNLSDSRMEALADNGNGTYHYIDSIGEARKVLVDELGGTLQTVAKDVKLQVEFNPAVVKGYRLIGYENRTMAAEDFADDTKDGGEIGAGHQMTALYEIARIGSGQEVPEITSKYGTIPEQTTDGAQKEDEAQWLTLGIRYKEPDGDVSSLLEYPVDHSSWMEEMDADFSWAAGIAQAGMLLKDSRYKGTSTYKDARTLLRQAAAVQDDSYRDEFIYLLDKMEKNQ